MEGITVEIADHPITGHKRKVLIDGLEIRWSRETIELESICTFYENIAGAYGEAVSIPQPIVIKRILVARTANGKVVFVDNRTGATVLRKERPTGVEDEVEEYWVLESDEVTEVPLEFVQKLFFFLENIVRNHPTVVGQLLQQFINDEVKYGSYDQI